MGGAGLAGFADRPRQVRDLEDLVAEPPRDKGGDDDAAEVFAVAFATQPSLPGTSACSPKPGAWATTNGIVAAPGRSRCAL